MTKGIRRLCALLLTLWQLAGAALAAPLEQGVPVELSAPSAMLVEAGTGTVIFEKNADERRQVASVTKLMTLLICFEELAAGTGSLEDPEELAREGARKLADKAVSESIRANVMDTPGCRYGERWDRGARVTVAARGGQMQAGLTQVQESHEAGRAVRLEVTFGSPAGGIERVIRQRTRPVVR